MEFIRIPVTITDSELSALKSLYAAALEQIAADASRGAGLGFGALKDLQLALSQVVHKQQPLYEVIDNISKGSGYCHVNLTHRDAEILNLPWGIALDPVTESRTLNEIPRFFMSKNSLTRESQLREPTAGPLKILVMISMPKDYPFEKRLDYESEEMMLLQAFAPLYKPGEIQIDFTDNGSLEALRRKTDLNRYHILHFSGHGAFDEKQGEGVLALEDDMTLKQAVTKGSVFAEAMMRHDHCIPLVVLSACESAKALYEKGMASVTETLLQRGVQAVVSMGAS
ncbi:MAG TPA: CHAT domain-containing protein, partial [Thermodesulfovibrionia bacterium]|nr:CHAT domain-containing protein [Thermodesulfovibrionia bacterium]